jgi:glycosyltransferase involved in cell wall biosynthesis
MDRLVNAFALIADKYPEWYIDIYGEGELHDEVQQLITRKGLDRQIHLQAPTSQIYEQYQTSQFFVLSSDFEGFGLVIVEAMACGIPVVVTDCPFGPSEIVEDGKTGLLARMDEHDLAAKMEWMMSHDREREEMGARAYEAAGRYRKEIIMKEWEQAYLSVVNIEKKQ